MRPHRASCATTAVVLALAVATACDRSAASSASSSPPRIIGHPIRVDAQRKLLSWSPAAPYATVARLAWETLETRFPVQDNGFRTWLTYSRFDPDTFDGIAWPHNPAGLYAMFVDSAVLWYAFSGDADAVALARTALDHQLAHGTTPGEWDWARVPYASAGAGDVDYHGADDEWCDFCGRGDGIGVIEPDKVGELGFAYLQLFEVTGDERYRDAAIDCADALAKHVRAGDDRHSPWPFRVYAETNVVREEYSSNVIGAIELFDALVRLSLGDGEAYVRARALAFDWLMRVPMTRDTWSGYFEDIGIQTDPGANPNQYSALRTARWLMDHPDADAAWRTHVAHLVAWAVDVFGRDTATERGTQWGATVMSEQGADMAKMGSHTARLGATLAQWSAATNDAAARDRAARSLNWATYACGEDGVVAVGENKDEGWWFSDGYADYVRQFLRAMGAQPQWAPAGESHIVRSTSIVAKVAYEPEAVTWTTFDDDAVETLRLPYRPWRVRVEGQDLPRRTSLDAGDGYSTAPLPSGDVLVRIRHRARGPVTVSSRRLGRGEAGDGEAIARPPR
jgi:hypothetical protein